MNYVLNAAEMQRLDDYTIREIGIPGMVLMERAALAVSQWIRAYMKEQEINGCSAAGGKILVAAGTGNNGGDGIAAARQLYLQGYDVDLYIVGNRDRGSRAFADQLAVADRLGMTIAGELTDQYQVIVDSIFGIGLSREITGGYREVIEQLNAMKGCRLAVDIPSGVDATTGQIMGTAFQADATITFGYKKVGQLLYPGAEYCGRLECADIGFPKQAAMDTQEYLVSYTDEDLARLPERQSRSNKGTYGKALVLAGRKNMAGAAYLSAAAAYRSGCGLVQLLTEEENRIVIQQLLPEAVLHTYSSPREAGQLLTSALGEASAAVIGPGLGCTEETGELLELIFQKAELPLLIDADGLNVISLYPRLQELLKKYSYPVVITPHLKEMSRLSGKPVKDIAGHMIAVAKDYGKEYNVTVVLKDARTIVAGTDGRAYINVSGNHGMATGGSGDVLSGIIGGLLTQGMDAFEAAKLGAFLHGLAGDKAAEEKGCRSMLAGDILEHFSSLLSAADR